MQYLVGLAGLAVDALGQHPILVLVASIAPLQFIDTGITDHLRTIRI